LLGKTGDLDLANARKLQLQDLGFSPSIIVIHPDDVSIEDRESFLKMYGLPIS